MNHFINVDIFAHLSEQDQTDFSDFCQLQHLNAGDVLFREWDEPQALYIISSGRMLIQKTLNGGQKNIAMLWEWDLVWEMAFFWNPPLRNATVTADIDSTVIVILKFSMEQMMKKYPELHAEIKSIIEERSV